MSHCANDNRDAFTYSMAQLNPKVGDIKANYERIKKALDTGREACTDLVITPELSLTGYPTDDLTLRPEFLDNIRDYVDKLAGDTENGPALIVGAPWVIDGQIYNAALTLQNGRITHVNCKHDLPQYGPFDDQRVFTDCDYNSPVTINGYQIGLLICEDAWTTPYAEHLKAQGAEILIAINASPFEEGKEDARHAVARACVKATGCPMLYVNQVGAQDELLFDGASFAMDRNGTVITRMPEWQEDINHNALEYSEYNKGQTALIPSFIEITPRLDPDASLYTGLVLSIRDYARKNGFKSAVIGISGGADSALTTALAVDALGAKNVHALMLPSGYTSDESHVDASFTARSLGCHYSQDLSIAAPFEAIKGELKKRWDASNVPITMENIQARLRMLLLFAVSNEENHLVLNTSNKSEVAMGHSTLYGDTAGGFAPLMDIFKTRVFALSKWRNDNTSPIGYGPAHIVISPNIFVKDPTPELSPNQTDRDLLPPYDILDPIIKALVEDERSAADIIKDGADAATVHMIQHKMQTQQFKRFQMPPGPKVTKRSFNKRERRYPITNGHASVRRPV